MEDKLNILLVDDQPAKLISYEAVLNGLGENLIKARSGMEALEQLLRNEIALVLMDVCMPGMDGFETAEMIHQHPRFHNMPIVFVSGIHVTETDRLKGYQHGAVDYLPVPVTPELLRAKVKVYVDLHRKTRELEVLNTKITLVQEEERRRIARELHDSVGQLLAGIAMNHALAAPEFHKLSATAADRLNENAAMVNEVSKQIRTISYLLHPPMLDEAGLASALRCYVDGFAKRSKISTTLETTPEFGRLPDDIEISVFRLVQECLTNIHRHSGSSTAKIRLTLGETCLKVEIEDAGKGIEEEQPEPNQDGVGMLGMRERLRHLGGTLDIYSSDRGTKLTALIPITRSSPLGVAHAPTEPCTTKAPAG